MVWMESRVASGLGLLSVLQAWDVTAQLEVLPDSPAASGLADMSNLDICRCRNESETDT